MLGVAPGRQGRGHGSALLRAVLDRADRSGVQATSPANRRVYQRFGFAVTGVITGSERGTGWTALQVPKRRSSGDGLPPFARGARRRSPPAATYAMDRGHRDASIATSPWMSVGGLGSARCSLTNLPAVRVDSSAPARSRKTLTVATAPPHERRLVSPDLVDDLGNLVLVVADDGVHVGLPRSARRGDLVADAAARAPLTARVAGYSIPVPGEQARPRPRSFRAARRYEVPGAPATAAVGDDHGAGPHQLAGPDGPIRPASTAVHAAVDERHAATLVVTPSAGPANALPDLVDRQRRGRVTERRGRPRFPDPARQWGRRPTPTPMPAAGPTTRAG